MMRVIAILGLVILAACTAPTVPILSAASGGPVTGAFPTGPDDTCDGARYGSLVGADATALERVLILRQVRVIRPGMAVTQDYRAERINFEIGADERIMRIRCG